MTAFQSVTASLDLGDVIFDRVNSNRHLLNGDVEQADGERQPCRRFTQLPECGAVKHRIRQPPLFRDQKLGPQQADGLGRYLPVVRPFLFVSNLKQQLRH